jgi:hypothetical protein
MTQTHITEFHIIIAGISDQEADAVYKSICDYLSDYRDIIIESGYVHLDQAEETTDEEIPV